MRARLSAAGRTTVAAGLAVFAARRLVLLGAALLPPRRRLRAGEAPSACVIVPARNEGSVLEHTLAALAGLEGSSVSVVLVDDGSSDETREVMDRWARAQPNWSSLSLYPGRGKGTALNAGIAASPASDLIVVCDADVRVEPDCLAELVQAFADPGVGAASALLVPANCDESIVTRYCALELWQHQLITSVAKDRLHLNPPAHGWLSCYRRAALEQVGGFVADSLGEDVQATNALVRAGWQTRFVITSRVASDVPRTVTDYWHQHVRWSRGLHAASPSGWDNEKVSVPRRIEAWLHAAGYLDRTLLLGAVTSAAFGELPRWVPVGYAGLTATEAVCALALAGRLRGAPRFLAAAGAMFTADVAASLAGSASQFMRSDRRWHSPRRDVQRRDEARRSMNGRNGDLALSGLAGARSAQ